MAGGADEGAIVVKKVINVSAAHHGGSWKVAYADFVTAMMAFFLLLWLLNVTSAEQRQGIADYFAPTAVSFSSASGAGGMLAGKSMAEEGARASASAPPVVTFEITAPKGEEDEDSPSRTLNCKDLDSVTERVPYKLPELEVAPLDRVFGGGIGAREVKHKTRIPLAT